MDEAMKAHDADTRTCATASSTRSSAGSPNRWLRTRAWPEAMLERSTSSTWRRWAEAAHGRWFPPRAACLSRHEVAVHHGRDI